MATSPKLTSQAVVIEQAEPNPKKLTKRLALFNEDGTPFSGGGGAPLPALATAQELEDGTVTEPRLFSPKLIHDEIARQIAAIPAP